MRRLPAHVREPGLPLVIAAIFGGTLLFLAVNKKL